MRSKIQIENGLFHHLEGFENDLLAAFLSLDHALNLDFLAALRKEYRARQQQELGQLHFSRLDDDDDHLEPDPSTPQEA